MEIFVTLSRAIELADVQFTGDIPLQCCSMVPSNITACCETSLKRNSKFCQAIAHVSWLQDIQILRKFFDLDEILKLDNWKVHPWNSKNVHTSEHTCGKAVEEPAENESGYLKLTQDIGTGEKLLDANMKSLPLLINIYVVKYARSPKTKSCIRSSARQMYDILVYQCAPNASCP